jgi:hypothetical protein
VSTKRLVIIPLLFAGLLLVTQALWAEQMFPLPIAGLAAKAQLIVQGRVVSTEVRRDEAGRIYTAVQIQVDEVWKGSLATNQFTIVHGGGVLGDRVAVVSGEAKYAVGEEIVAFLVLNQRGEGVSIGLSQGKFQVSKDAATGEKLAHNRFHGLHPAAPNAATNAVGATPILNRLTLADLKRRAQGDVK